MNRIGVAAVMVLIAMTAVSRAGANLQSVDRSSLPDPYRPVTGWGQLPAGRSWGAPSAEEVDRDGRSMWVVERCGARRADAQNLEQRQSPCVGSNLPPILKFDASGRLLTSFGAGLFVFPHGLHIDRDGNVWVTDGQGKNGKGQQVFKFSPDGRILLVLGTAGVAGDGPRTFNQPSDVAVAPNGDIFVTDGHTPVLTPRIVKFSKDGTFLKAWGKKGSGPGELDDPHCIEMDSQGRLFVCDRKNDRIQIFSQDGQSLGSWTQFGRPSGIFIDRDDTMYVASQDSGIWIGSAKDGSVRGLVRGGSAESVAADASGTLYAGEIGAMTMMKYVKK
jgi:sugar lactone lactonase YvrE